MDGFHAKVHAVYLPRLRCGSGGATGVQRTVQHSHRSERKINGQADTNSKEDFKLCKTSDVGSEINKDFQRTKN